MVAPSRDELIALTITQSSVLEVTPAYALHHSAPLSVLTEWDYRKR
jgi:hypothetical protein